MGSGLCGAIELPPGNPVPWEDIVEQGLRRIRDVAEDIGELALRIDVVELGGAPTPPRTTTQTQYDKHYRSAFARCPPRSGVWRDDLGESRASIRM